MNELKMMLVIEDLTVYNFAKLPILRDVNFTLSKGELMIISGVNGSGKTELATALTGHNAFSAKKSTYNNHDLKALSPFEIARLGIALVPEERLLFKGLSVENHLELGLIISSLFPKTDAIKKALDRVYGYFPKLYERKKQEAVTLSGGEQQMLCIGRALVSNPTCLILDEPTQGLSVQIAQNFLDTVVSFKKEDLSIILIEQGIQKNIDQSDVNKILYLEDGKAV